MKVMFGHDEDGEVWLEVECPVKGGTLGGGDYGLSLQV